jgi:hypothetical protein
MSNGQTKAESYLSSARLQRDDRESMWEVMQASFDANDSSQARWMRLVAGALDRSTGWGGLLYSALEDAVDEMRAGSSESGEPKKQVPDLTEKVAKLKQERDEARTRVCELCARMGGVYRRVDGKTVECTTPESVAEVCGWGYLYNQREAKEDR